ncbi:MAG: hypothetical protein HYY76_14365 [Acidobacteria bacterium]|nr:hypothetical protein [Acidobacteriota bacterium]
MQQASERDLPAATTERPVRCREQHSSNGDFLRGIFWLIVTPGFWIGSGGLLGWICHLIAAYTAFYRAQDKNRGLA